jgi:hypothetical protein
VVGDACVGDWRVFGMLAAILEATLWLFVR